MINLFLFSTQLLTVLFFLAICIFAAQATYVCVLIANRRLRKKRVLVSEFVLMIYIGIVSLIFVTVIVNKIYSMADISYISAVLNVVGIGAVGYFSTVIARGTKGYVTAILGVIATMPFVGDLFFRAYYIGIAIAFVLFASRLYFLISKEFESQKSELSYISIKDGLDTLPAGVMFCEANGYIFLTNTRMRDLIRQMINNEQKSGKLFWDKLVECNIVGWDSQVVGEDILIRNSREVWRFSKNSFTIGINNYFEIIAIDVTEVTGAFFKLEEERVTLEERNEATKRLLKKIEFLRKEREYVRIRSQVHDVLSQRLTAIQRMTQDDSFTDYSALLFLSRDAIMHIKEKQGGNAKELFGEIYHYYRKIGLEIELMNDLPREDNIAFLFLAVLREACTNAIKHAGATKVFAKIISVGDKYRIEITNNGDRPSKGLIEGGGLFGIRNRIESAGGILKVEVIPEFSLIITIGRAV